MIQREKDQGSVDKRKRQETKEMMKEKTGEKKGEDSMGRRVHPQKRSVSWVNSVLRQFLPNGLPSTYIPKPLTCGTSMRSVGLKCGSWVGAFFVNAFPPFAHSLVTLFFSISFFIFSFFFLSHILFRNLFIKAFSSHEV